MENKAAVAAAGSAGGSLGARGGSGGARGGSLVERGGSGGARGGSLFERGGSGAARGGSGGARAGSLGEHGGDRGGSLAAGSAGAEVAADSVGKIFQLGDAIAALTLDEARSLIDHLQERLGVFARAFGPGVAGLGKASPSGWRASGSKVPPTASTGSDQGSPRGLCSVPGSNQGSPRGPCSAAGCNQGKCMLGCECSSKLISELYDITEQNARKPELSELKEVKEQVLNAMFQMEDGAEGIRSVIKVLLESCNLYEELLDSLCDDLGTVAIRLEAQAREMKPVVHILRERPKFSDWDIPSTPSLSTEGYDTDE